MPFISVVPSSKIISIGEPIVFEDLEFPSGVVSIYYNTETKEGYCQLEDPKAPLQKIEYSDIKPYVEAYEKKKSPAEKKKSRSKKKSEELVDA